ncbi:MAG: sulfotransferase domain-containing protein [Bacteroidia bacterium]|nr:sulfotransferase domain-containing protein [Bacteroidia bacterium]NND51964.1 hypothetical protein [Flavobacteriaceae bacterium]
MILFKTIKGKLEQATRLLFVNSLTFLNDSILIVEYPKSGGSWLGQLVATYLDIPFPRNRFPILRRSVYHSHYQPKYVIHKNKKILWLVRDGRDVCVSFYYHQLIWSNKNKLDPKTVTYTRKNLKFDNYEDITNNLPEYIEYSFTHTPPKSHYFNFPGNWESFNSQWNNEYDKNNSNIYLLKYEDLLNDTEGTLRQLFADFFNVEIDENKLKEVVHKYSFESQTQRNKGEEDTSSFLRKGISGDWKNKFNDNAKDVFKKYGGKMLIKLGYEKNDQW